MHRWTILERSELSLFWVYSNLDPQSFSAYIKYAIINIIIPVNHSARHVSFDPSRSQLQTVLSLHPPCIRLGYHDPTPGMGDFSNQWAYPGNFPASRTTENDYHNAAE